MPVSTDNIIKAEQLAKWLYLDSVDFPCIQTDMELLIGINASNLLEPWEVINSQGNGPYAIRTLLGCVINGPLSGYSDEQGDNNHTTAAVKDLYEKTGGITDCSI